MRCIIIVKFPKDCFLFCSVHQHGDDVRWKAPICDCNAFVYHTAVNFEGKTKDVVSVNFYFPLLLFWFPFFGNKVEGALSFRSQVRGQEH